jgi:hypothetical protein
MLDGDDRSELVQVSPADGIVNRLTKVLELLARDYPQEGWSQFLESGAAPR